MSPLCFQILQQQILFCLHTPKLTAHCTLLRCQAAALALAMAQGSLLQLPMQPQGVSELEEDGLLLRELLAALSP